MRTVCHHRLCGHRRLSHNQPSEIIERKKGAFCGEFNIRKNPAKAESGKRLSQKQPGQQMFVNHSTVARRENASRLPDATMIPRIANSLGVDANELFQLVAQSQENPECHHCG